MQRTPHKGRREYVCASMRKWRCRGGIRGQRRVLRAVPVFTRTTPTSVSVFVPVPRARGSIQLLHVPGITSSHCSGRNHEGVPGADCRHTTARAVRGVRVHTGQLMLCV